MKFVWRFLGFLLSIFGSVVLIRTILYTGFDFGKEANVFLAVGLIIGLLFFALIPQCRFLNLYVFGHELTHWIVAKLMFKETGGLGSIKISSKGGCVMVYEPNFVITLAPYFVPFYTLIMALISWMVNLFAADLIPQLNLALICYFLLGISYAYHIVMTFIAISIGQKDLRDAGAMFSLAFIVFCNLFFVFLTLFIMSNFALDYWKILWHEGIFVVNWLIHLATHGAI